MTPRRVGHFLFSIALLVTAESSMYAQSSPAQPAVTEAEDGYHFQNWQGSPFNAAYTEWWYFNLYDVKDNIQAIFTYQVADPLNLTGEGGGDMTVVVYQGNNVIPESDLYPLSSFTASPTAANVTLGSNTISVAGPNTYLVTGATMDGVLSWNLHYDRVAPSWFAGIRMNVAPAKWEQMSWLLYMPRADVYGTLTINGQVYNIECSGYHDHNWGQWNFESVVWNWAQYSQPNLTFDLGDFVGNPNGRASVDIGGNRTVFSANQYSLVHTKWAFDPVDNVQYPIQSTFTASNGDVSVNLVMNVQQTQPLPTGPPPSLVIYEQTARYTGTVTVQSQRIAIPVSGDAFKEYTAISSAAP